MVGAGIFAALMVTPGPDEEALPRPADADVVVAAAAPLSWDPAAISDSESAQLLSQVFEGLTVLDATSTLRPALAESWEVEDEGRRIVFTLREGLTFSDGSALDAADVRRSWLRVIDPARPSPLASLLDDVVGAAAYARGEGPADAVGLHADGPHAQRRPGAAGIVLPGRGRRALPGRGPRDHRRAGAWPASRHGLLGVGRLCARGRGARTSSGCAPTMPTGQALHRWSASAS